MASGVSMQSPETCFLSIDPTLKRGCVIEPYDVFGTGVQSQRSTIVRSYSYIEDSHWATLPNWSFCKTSAQHPAFR